MPQVEITSGYKLSVSSSETSQQHYAQSGYIDGLNSQIHSATYYSGKTEYILQSVNSKMWILSKGTEEPVERTLSDINPRTTDKTSQSMRSCQTVRGIYCQCQGDETKMSC